MRLHRPGRTLWSIAALALPALAVAPGASIGATAAAATAPAPAFARVIVKFKADGALARESTLAARDPDRAPVQHAARLAQRTGMALTDGYAIAPRTQVLFAKGIGSAQLVQRLQLDPDVEYAEVDQRVKIAVAPNDPLYPNGLPASTPAVGQWYLRANGPSASGTTASAINAEAAWDKTKGSPAIVVAVLDTGVRFDHPDLAGKLLPGYDFVSADGDGSFTSANDGNGRDADPSDPGDWVTQAEHDATNGPLAGCEVGSSSWHGTQTSALIGALTNNGVGMAGVGRNVRILPVRVLGKCGGFTSDVIAGMYWAAGIAIPASPSTLGTAPANPFPAQVLSLSLGSPAATCSTLYQTAIAAVRAAGASVVVSAGNDEGLAVGQPANCPGAIGVGGLRHTGTKVGFSDVGPQIAISAPGGNCVNLSGPCLFPILTATNSGTTVPAANTYSDANNPSVGTSFSAPLVAGTVALMLSVNPTLTPANVQSILQTSAAPFPVRPSGSSIPQCLPPSATIQDECYCTTSTCGAGMLDANAAVTAVTAPATTQPLIFATPAAPAPNVAIALDGSTSVLATGRTIANTGYKWTLVDPGGIASLAGVVPAIGPTATVNTIGEGRFTVQLELTDSNNVATTKRLTVTVANPPANPNGGPIAPGSGGGGALSWPWLALLALALLPLGQHNKIAPQRVKTPARRRV